MRGRTKRSNESSAGKAAVKYQLSAVWSNIGRFASNAGSSAMLARSPARLRRPFAIDMKIPYLHASAFSRRDNTPRVELNRNRPEQHR
jgi:hypothetical protein